MTDWNTADWDRITRDRATAHASATADNRAYEEPYPDAPAQRPGTAPAPEGGNALRIDTGGASFPGGVFVDGQKVR
jgi:hypothetical protein